jgi:hypothetical protein
MPRAASVSVVIRLVVETRCKHAGGPRNQPLPVVFWEHQHRHRSPGTVCCAESTEKNWGHRPMETASRAPLTRLDPKSAQNCNLHNLSGRLDPGYRKLEPVLPTRRWLSAEYLLVYSPDLQMPLLLLLSLLLLPPGGGRSRGLEVFHLLITRVACVRPDLAPLHGLIFSRAGSAVDASVARQCLVHTMMQPCRRAVDTGVVPTCSAVLCAAEWSFFAPTARLDPKSRRNMLKELSPYRRLS